MCPTHKRCCPDCEGIFDPRSQKRDPSCKLRAGSGAPLVVQDQAAKNSLRAGARAGGAVALEENAQAVECEQVVDLLDVARIGGDEVRKAAAGDDARLAVLVGAEFGENALDDAVDEADVAEVNSALQMADGVGADDLGGALDVDAVETRGAVETARRRSSRGRERWRRPGTRPRGDHFEFGGCAEVDHDARAAVALVGGDASRTGGRRRARLGLSMSIFMPVLMPGSTNMGSMWK
jgi:hypothetical protein